MTSALSLRSPQLEKASRMGSVPILGKLLLAFGAVLVVSSGFGAMVFWKLWVQISRVEAASDAVMLWSVREILLSDLHLAFWLGISSFIAGGVGVLAASVFIRSMVVRPVEIARDLATRIAAHDLRSSITATATDETGVLTQALVSMQQSLKDTLQQVQRSSHVIAQSAAEVAEGSMDLSARTEQTAASLEETSATISSLIQIVNTNVDSSIEASSEATEASNSVAQGRSSVDRVVETMAGIHSASRGICQ